jgi:hypothetical protein
MSQSVENLTKIFLSSTSKDLVAFRQAVGEAVIQREMHPIMMERFPAVSRDALDVCKQKVEEADLFIGIYADRYGYCPRNGNQSITEMEYDWAEKRGIERLIFVFDKDKAALPDTDLVYQYADHNPKMTDFLNRIGKEVVWKTFTSPEDLKYQVYQSLEAWQKHPENRKWLRPMAEMPDWVRWVSMALLLVTLIVLGYTLAQLFRAGQEPLGLVAMLIGIVVTLLPLLSFYLMGVRETWLELPGVGQLKPWHIMLILQVLAVVGITLVSQPALRVVADDLVDQAFTTQNLTEAQSQLESAALLGADVATALDGELAMALRALNLPDEDARAIQLARLLVQYAPLEMQQYRADDVEAQARNAAQNRISAQTKRLVQVLGILNSDQAASLAQDFYREALSAYTAQPPQITVTLSYLDAFLAVDDMTETSLSSVQLSNAHYVRGVVLELGSQPTAAFDAYRQALMVDDSNLEARYALASGLLIQVENGGDRALLTEAITLARTGYQEYISADFCRGSHNLNDPESFHKVWNCFALMTTEAGARSLRAGSEDTVTTLRGLLERAIRLAEANDQFGDAYYTAEAYYWLAKTTMPEAATEEGLALYCAIIQQHDSTKPRHRQWVAFANEQLNGRYCF